MLMEGDTLYYIDVYYRNDITFLLSSAAYERCYCMLDAVVHNEMGCALFGKGDVVTAKVRFCF